MSDFILLLVLGGVVHAVQSFRAHEGEGSDVAGIALSFGLLMLAALYAGRLLSRIRLPKVVAYLLVGVAVGPSALDMVTETTVRDLGMVNGVAVCLIALTAGSELDLRRFRPLLRVIVAVTFFAVGGTCVVLTIVLFLLHPLLPFLSGFTVQTAFAVCAMIGIALSAQSPAVVMALLSETRADGPLSRTMLGTVVVADLVVIVLFAISSVAVQATMGGEVDAGGAALAITWELLGSFAVGAAIGGLLILHMRLLRRGLMLFVLLVCVVVAEVGRRVHLDPLIVMLSAGVLVQNLRAQGAAPLLHEIERTSLPVYLVFFALAGASMHLHLLATLWLPATLVVVARAASFWAGARLGTSGAGVEPAVRKWAFAGLLPQAGLALALAMLVERALGEVGPAASALVLAVIAMNELLMPIVVRRALESADETGKRHEEASIEVSIAVETEPAGAHSAS